MASVANRILLLSSFSILIGFCSKGIAETDQTVDSLNVVLILADDLGYGDLSCYGQTEYRTPHIDQLAAEGVRATDFYVVAPYCAASRAGLLTGRFPLRNGMTRNPHPDKGDYNIDNIGIRADELTLGEVYQNKGYATSCIGKWHLGHKEPSYPVNHGFDEYFGILYSNDMLPIQIIENTEIAENPVDQRYLTQKYTDKAVDFIERNRDRPFFLYLPHAMPHKPLAASDAFYTPETPDDLYHDVIRELDWSVGKIVETLEANGILENTIVIFMSDNGPHFGGSSGGFKGKKSTPWEGGIRVPFIIRYPAFFPKGRTLSTPLWSLDLFPTLLDLTGVKLPDGLVIDGENIVEILKGNRKSRPPIYSAHNEETVTIRDGDWKLYLAKPRYLSARDLDPDWVDPTWPNGVTIIAQSEQPNSMQYPGIVPEKFDNDFPLFNLANDSTESVDVSASHPEVVEQLKKEYLRFLATMPQLANQGAVRPND